MEKIYFRFVSMLFKDNTYILIKDKKVLTIKNGVVTEHLARNDEQVFRGRRAELIEEFDGCNLSKDEINRVLEPFMARKPIPNNKKVLFKLKN